MRRAAGAALVVAMVLGGCSDPSGSPATTPDDPSSSVSTGADPADSTGSTGSPVSTLPPLLSAFGGGSLTGQPADLAAARAANGGRLPADVALDLFAAGVGDLPGADADRFVSDGDLTMALRAVLANWESYSDEQRAAVRATLGYPITQGFVGAGAATPADPSVLAQVDAAVSTIEGLMGVTLSIPISVTTIPDLSYDGEPVNGLTWPERGGELVSSGRADRCRVHLTAGAGEGTVAHEVFHCFQADLATDVADVFGLGGEDWLIEGSASWAAAEVAGIDDFAVASFQIWALHTDSVFQLDYPAIGFFWSLEDMGTSPWEVIPEMLGKSGVDAVAATGLDPAKVLTHLASIITRARTTSPIPVSDVWDFSTEVPSWGERTDLVVSPGNGLDEGLPGAFFAKGMNLHVTVEDAQRVRVLMDSDVGTLEFFEQSPITWAQRLGREFCIDPDGCTCGADGTVDSGLEQGGPDLMVVPGEMGAGPMTYRIEVPDDVFTDGTWTGTVTSSVLVISDGVNSGERAETTFPFELTIVDGAVTAGIFKIGFATEVTTATGTGQGVLVIAGGFAGCGFAPQFLGSGLLFEGTMTVRDVTLPLVFDSPIPDGGGGLDTVWLPGPITNPDVRSGSIDPGGSIGAIAAGGFNVNDLQLTFQATRTP